MRRCFLAALIVGLLAWLCPQPEAKAMDPVTISLLAPLALQGAKIAAPYILKGLKNAGKAAVYAGKDILEIFLLPIGFFETTFGFPFGLFFTGLRHIGTGALAPFKLCVHVLCIPIGLFGVSI